MGTEDTTNMSPHNISMEPDLWRQVKEQAHKEDVSVAAIVRAALKDYLQLAALESQRQ
jgi:hypothetical protein